jgi:tRNA (guanine37-N1)-methyltransferase
VQIDIITIFPEFFRGPLDHGIIRRAREAELVKIEIRDLRVFTRDRHRTVDDRPFGGGEGMVLKPEPIFECVESLGLAPREDRHAKKQSVILLSAQGKRFDQSMAAELSALDRVILICGRYEGVDERVGTHLADREVSIGDYVLSGGELGAAVMIDTVTRLIPGALGNEASARQESFHTGAEVAGDGLAGEGARPRHPDSTCASGGLLDYPHYTRPAEFRGMKIPEVLLNGNHEDIRRWRRRSALEKTYRNRPDLLDDARLSDEDKDLLAEIQASSSWPLGY